MYKNLGNLLKRGREAVRYEHLEPGLVAALSGIYCAFLGVGLYTGYPLSSWSYWKSKGFESRLWFHVMLPFGAIVGTVIGVFSNKYLGQNKTIAAGSITAIAASLILSREAELISPLRPFIGVSLMGITCGLISETAPNYVHECSHHRSRGRFLAGQYTAMAIGLSISILTGLYAQNNDLWLAVSLIPFIVGAILLSVSPVSPLWLAEHNRSDENIRDNLQQLHGRSSYVNEHMQYLRKPKVQLMSHDVKALSKPEVYKPLAVIIVMMFIQQVTGLGGLLANFDVVSAGGRAKTTALAFVGSHVIASLIAPLLIDCIGRPKMLKISGYIQSLGLSTLGYMMNDSNSKALEGGQQNALIVAGFSLVVIGYSLGNGPIPWIMVNELLPRKGKIIATAASTSSNWAFDCIMAPIFSGLITTIGPKIMFYSFAVIALLGILFVEKFVPDTANLSIEDLEQFVEKYFQDVFNQEKKVNDPNDVVIQNSPETKDKLPDKKDETDTSGKQ